MTSTPDANRLTGVGALLMTLVLLWSGALAVGFGWAAITGADQMSFGRTLVFALIAGFLGLLCVRTTYELIRRFLGTRRVTG